MMNDDLFDMTSYLFERADVGIVTRWHRDVLLSDGFTIRIHVMESGNMISIFAPGTPATESRLCHMFFAADSSVPGYLRPHPYIVNHNPATREELMDTIKESSEAAFEWSLWNLI